MERDWNTGAISRRHVYGPGLDDVLLTYEGSGLSDRRYQHQDERGSVIGLSNGSGGLTSVNAYDEYGIPASGNTGRFQYTGLPWVGQLGMQYSRNRIYSPTLGRFLQTDPIGYQGGMNLYAYVRDDPVNMTDPSGEKAEIPSGCGTRIRNADSASCSGETLIDRIGGDRSRRDNQASAQDENPRSDGAEERDELACVGPIRKLCGSIIGSILRRIARDAADRTAREMGLTIDRVTRIGSGGRSGGGVPFLRGPPNSIVGKPAGNGLWITNSEGQVVRDLTFTGGGNRIRVRDVYPGRGFSPRRPPNIDELRIWRGF